MPISKEGLSIIKKIELTGASFLALVSVSCDIPNKVDPTISAPIPIGTLVPKEAITAATPAELLVKHQTRLIELSRIFTEEGKYPKEEVDQWLNAAGVTGATVNGLPHPTMIRTERIGDREVPSGVLGFGTNMDVKYPAYVESSPNPDYQAINAIIELPESRKFDTSRARHGTTDLAIRLWTNVQVSNPTGAIFINVDGTNIPQLSPR